MYRFCEKNAIERLGSYLTGLLLLLLLCVQAPSLEMAFRINFDHCLSVRSVIAVRCVYDKQELDFLTMSLPQVRGF